MVDLLASVFQIIQLGISAASCTVLLTVYSLLFYQPLTQAVHRMQHRQWQLTGGILKAPCHS